MGNNCMSTVVVGVPCTGMLYETNESETIYINNTETDSKTYNKQIFRKTL